MTVVGRGGDGAVELTGTLHIGVAGKRNRRRGGSGRAGSVHLIEPPVGSHSTHRIGTAAVRGGTDRDGDGVGIRLDRVAGLIVQAELIAGIVERGAVGAAVAGGAAKRNFTANRYAARGRDARGEIGHFASAVDHNIRVRKRAGGVVAGERKNVVAAQCSAAGDGRGLARQNVLAVGDGRIQKIGALVIVRGAKLGDAVRIQIAADLGAPKLSRVAAQRDRGNADAAVAVGAAIGVVEYIGRVAHDDGGVVHTGQTAVCGPDRCSRQVDSGSLCGRSGGYAAGDQAAVAAVLLELVPGSESRDAQREHHDHSKKQRK